jgi:ATP-dependent RNA helicase DDX42
MANASGYGSDEEVYATAKAVDRAEQYDSDDDPAAVAAAADQHKIEPLPALDHASIEYDDFAKAFYEEDPAVAAMSHAEVGIMT